MKNEICHLEQRIHTDDEKRSLPQMSMMSDRIRDPTIYDNRISTSKDIKDLPTIPTCENKEMYDI